MNLQKLARATLGLFVLSTAFPFVAGFVPTDQVPKWLGVGDITFAALFLLALATLATRTRQVIEDRHRLRAFNASQAMLGVVPVLLVVFFILGSRVNWTVLVIGLAWRLAILAYALPSFAAALESPRT